MVRDEVVGVLDFQSEQAEYFDAGMIDLLTLFSTQASLALENARLYSLERRRAEQLEAINAVARQTTAVLDLDELLTVVCRLILEWFRIDHVAVLLAESDCLRVRAYEGTLTPNVAMGAQLAPGAGLASRALSQAKSLIENDVSIVDGYIAGFLETKSEMCVPLIFFGEKLGVLALDSASHDAFDQDDVQPLESVADICAAAIQNAHYFERMKQLAYVDGLTGIFNRRYFEMRIAEELERACRFLGRMSVIMVDIDHFKKLNDEFGHLLGDEVLRGVSTILKQQLRKVDMVCRYGGEEFAIVVPETTGANALKVAEKLRRQIESHPFPGVPRPVTISCGVADYPTHGATRDEIVAAADGALYQAKQAGRNRVVAASAKKESSASK
jgi:diguanylate cyclase (GGDEF)-like protein